MFVFGILLLVLIWNTFSSQSMNVRILFCWECLCNLFFCLDFVRYLSVRSFVKCFEDLYYCIILHNALKIQCVRIGNVLGMADHGSRVFKRCVLVLSEYSQRCLICYYVRKIEFLEGYPWKESILKICSPDLLTDFANEIFRRCLRNMVASCSASGKLEVFAPISRKTSLLYPFLFFGRMGWPERV